MKIKYEGEHTVIGQEEDGTPITIKDYQKELLSMFRDITKILEKHAITYFMDGGSMLGAVRHKGMIPWDDDIDICFLLEDYKQVMQVLQAELDLERYAIQTLETDAGYDVTQPYIKVRKKGTYVGAYDAFYAKNTVKENGIFIDFIAVSVVPEPKKGEWRYRKMSLLRTLALLVLNKFSIPCKWLKKRHIQLAYTFAKKAQSDAYYGYALMNLGWRNIIWKKEDVFPLQYLPFEDMQVPVVNHYDEVLRQTYGDYMQIPNLEEVELLHSKDLKLKSDRMRP